MTENGAVDERRTLSDAAGCLRIISNFYFDDPLGRAAERDGEAPPAASMAALFARMEPLGLRCRERRCDGAAALLKMQGPCILLMRDGSCLVFLRQERQRGTDLYVLRDPNGGREGILAVDHRRLEAAWDGRVLEVRRRFFTVDSMPFGLRLILAHFTREPRMLVDVLASAVTVSFLGLVPIAFFRIATSKVLAYGALNTLLVITLILVALIGVETALDYFKRYLANRLSIKVEARISVDVVAKMLALPMEYFETVPAGETIFRVNLVERIRRLLLREFFLGILDLSTLLLFIPVMAYVNLKLTLVVLGVYAASMGWIFLLLPYHKVRSGALVKSETMRSIFLNQSIAGIRTIKSLALDARQRHQWQDLLDNTFDCAMAEGQVANLIEVGLKILQRLLIVLVMVIGVYDAISDANPASLPMMVAFVMLAQRVIGPLQQAANLVLKSPETLSAVTGVGYLVNRPPEQGRAAPGVVQPIEGHIVFKDVVFRYPGALNPALKSISFEIHRGTTLGVMGRSGSGKTTLTRLLQRLNSTFEGRIEVDGVELRDYDLDYLRASLGVVLQDSFLFSGSIRENIAIAKPDASFDEVIRAARLAGAAEFIDKLPRGYDTRVGDGATGLSGGQRQRIAIARALITDPKILIFDEATSALDAESEAVVNASLLQIAKGRTVIVISHRLASLVNSDAILVMDGGRVNDMGTHRELLERCDIYSNLWSHQNTEDEAEEAPAPRASNF